MTCLTGLCCYKSPAWAALVLRQVAPHLEQLDVLSPSSDHLQLIASMPRLVKLRVREEHGGGGARLKGTHLDSLAPQLTELRIDRGVRSVLERLNDMPNLRQLEVFCPFKSPVPGVSFLPPPSSTPDAGRANGDSDLARPESANSIPLSPFNTSEDAGAGGSNGDGDLARPESANSSPPSPFNASDDGGAGGTNGDGDLDRPASVNSIASSSSSR